MKILMRKVDGSLVPEGEEAQKSVQKLKSGKSYMCNVTMPRSIGNHRRYFSLVNTLFDMQEMYDDPTVFRKLLTVAAGHFDNVTLPNGRAVLMPRSIAFERMPEDEFEHFFSATISVAIKKFGFDEESVNKVLNYI